MQDILFNEAEHKYYDGNGKTYTSVTTLIGKYTEVFDSEYWAMFTALKEHNYKVKPYPETKVIMMSGVKYKLKDLYKDALFSAWCNEVKAKWVSTTVEACLRGNATHNELEDSINKSKGDSTGSTNYIIGPSAVANKEYGIKTIHDLDQTIIKEKYPEVYDRLCGYIQREFSIFAEKKVFLAEYLIAGMIDVPLMKGKHFAILDWKTNKDTLHKTAGYYRKAMIGGKLIKTNEWIETGKTFNYPLNNLEASKFNIYALQLSLYAYILEQWGYILLQNGLEIIHFPLGESPRLLKMPYLKDEVKILLNHHKQSLLL